MNRPTQGMLLGLIGAVCLRLSISDGYRLYVNEWMRWPLMITAGVLLFGGLRLLWTRAGIGGEPGPASAWLLALPVVAVFAVSPPALGAYAAQRSVVDVTADKDFSKLENKSLLVMPVTEFVGRAQWDNTLDGSRVALTGFVTHGPGERWYLTRLSMSCCSADAVGYQVEISGSTEPRPDENSWVQVTGTWQKPDSPEIPRPGAPVMDATEVVPTTAPQVPYE